VVQERWAFAGTILSTAFLGIQPSPSDVGALDRDLGSFPRREGLLRLRERCDSDDGIGRDDDGSIRRRRHASRSEEAEARDARGGYRHDDEAAPPQKTPPERRNPGGAQHES
jgi:hypothetical protein